MHICGTCSFSSWPAAIRRSRKLELTRIWSRLATQGTHRLLPQRRQRRTRSSRGRDPKNLKNRRKPPSPYLPALRVRRRGGRNSSTTGWSLLFLWRRLLPYQREFEPLTSPLEIRKFSCSIYPLSSSAVLSFFLLTDDLSAVLLTATLRISWVRKAKPRGINSSSSLARRRRIRPRNRRSNSRNPPSRRSLACLERKKR